MSENFVTFHRNGLELHVCKLNGFRFVSFGMITGYVNGVACVESVIVQEPSGRRHVVTEKDTRGASTIRVQSPRGKPAYCGLADAATVSLVNAEV
ncbi:hypothetical protein [Allorhodopirellula solitaria]|uniref:Uncharacterized protein n=1 Tax=Allorhodopirellula solitaria TaxID=2527987 RepID=A0A5C5YC51_9BACT|nr:hypothetical protein [Allorhodopirellula solitaria]TWT73297.1 hypothetical protein CA85_17650 [Allorhodopirellula solitaria]